MASGALQQNRCRSEGQTVCVFVCVYVCVYVCVCMMNMLFTKQCKCVHSCTCKLCENSVRDKNPKSLKVVQAVCLRVCMCARACVSVCVYVCRVRVCKCTVGGYMAGNNACL